MNRIISFLLLLSFPAQAVHIRSTKLGLNLRTHKVSYVVGDVGPVMRTNYLKSVEDTQDLDGPRVIIINSGGGLVDEGAVIIRSMEAEKQKGTKMVCLVRHDAHSMAFNILTHCDVRLAYTGAQMLVHKIRVGGIGMMTAKKLRELADSLDRDDEVFRQENSKAMHLTLKQYDRKADLETMWPALTLLKMGYLDDIISGGK